MLGGTGVVGVATSPRGVCCQSVLLGLALSLLLASCFTPEPIPTLVSETVAPPLALGAPIQGPRGPGSRRAQEPSPAPPEPTRSPLWSTPSTRTTIGTARIPMG